jgi:hypothetical protein
MLSALINGKHYKQVVIDYYDDLIARLDVEAEETLEKFKNDDEFNKYENKKALICIINMDNFLHQQNQWTDELRNLVLLFYKNSEFTSHIFFGQKVHIPSLSNFASLFS